MADFNTLDGVNVAGKRVLLRADLNVPMKDGVVGDTTRIDRTVPGLIELADAGAKLVVITHFGRPKGARVPEMSLKPVADALAKQLGRPVKFADDCIGDAAASVVNSLKDGEIALLENLRYHAEEEKNDPAFVTELAKLGDMYVNDAFSCAHRAHASTEGLARALPAYAGRLMQAELEALGNALEAPKHPVMAIVGGAKISTKLDLLGNLVAKVDQLVIGGGMANTFLAAKGVNVGKSLCEHDLLDTAREIFKKAEAANCEIVLPVDGLVAKEFAANAPHDVCDINDVAADGMILDAGPATIEDLNKRLETCETLVWNGPLGAFEITPFDTATVSVAQHAAELTKAGKLLSVAGGGDTVAALRHADSDQAFSYVSTAGGAFLEWLEGKTLPGVAALRAS
ncbi:MULTISPECIES: phosphoglycerate kinase [unclassified Thalassospira]|uniref:phosphoglycerate kinase n=1 Tax=unclassified Thalassospira TaxID=2648997 RepID=UPI0007A608C6|nr:MULTISPECIES: phosphoglycerate kinase [unclassified Thalassospira]KZC98513.1 phosphoglycerate kinase [Thalassospira sp. MCCC 1A02898]ONH86626.1 phosphoglycerate kinase [Thalassospira sp. MCCC 1A02803]